MKLAFRDIEPFVKKPDPAARVILVYGPDDGLMRERSKAIGGTVVEDLNDPFNVAALSADLLLEDPAKLNDEANAMSMMGGDRLIRIENATDKLTPLLKEYLEAPSAHSLIILEAGELGPRSSLRQLCEKAKNAAALPCYVEDERDLGEDVGVGEEPDRRPGFFGFADHFEAAGGHATRERLRMALARPLHLELQLDGQRVHDRHTDAVESTRDLVAVLVELPAGV